MTRIACIGGFLGAGKTTALVEAAGRLMARGLKVGIITNDQGSHLVDTAFIRSLGIEADEITGGCFCCRFGEFVNHAIQIVDRHNPDIIFAEAVGSCTDLAATVYRPLKRYHSSAFELAPLTVFVEPARLEEFSSASSYLFDENVRYLFAKQLAEADLIVVNKSDSIDSPAMVQVVEAMRQLGGETPVITMSALTGAGMEEWLDRLMKAGSPERTRVEIDYEIYSKAEAALAWLNATVDLVSEEPLYAHELGADLIADIQKRCEAVPAAIAHLKLLLATEEGSTRMAVTTTESPSMLSGQKKLPPARELSIIINARTRSAPQELRKVIEDSLQAVSRSRRISITTQYMDAFAPPPPRPEMLHDQEA